MQTTSAPTIHVIDYGLGNIGSIANMIRKVGGVPVVCREPEALANAERIILPGVGAFDSGMGALEDTGFVLPLLEAVDRHVPLLGICLGMQLLFPASEEGSRPGLSLIRGRVRRFEATTGLKIPHMGWNRVEPSANCPLFVGLEDNRFYFVHSYHADCEAAENVAATTVYGQRFASAVQSGNVFGAQFHPEKSHKFGMCLLANFMGIR